MTGWHFSAVAAFSILLTVPVGNLLIYRLKRTRPDLWKRFGSPNPIFRDHLFVKYPHAGWTTAFKQLGAYDKVLLVAYALLHVVFVVALIATFAW